MSQWVQELLWYLAGTACTCMGLAVCILVWPMVWPKGKGKGKRG